MSIVCLSYMDYPNYWIDDNGNVFSIKSNKYLRPSVKSNGYAMITLFNEEGRKQILVHRLVAETFLNTWDNNLTVNHIDGNKLNNSSSNLEMLSSSDNRKHAFKLGLISQARTKNNNSKLTEIDVTLIRSNYNSGISNRSLAKEFNVSRETIRKIRNNTYWRN